MSQDSFYKQKLKCGYYCQSKANNIKTVYKVFAWPVVKLYIGLTVTIFLQKLKAYIYIHKKKQKNYDANIYEYSTLL